MERLLKYIEEKREIINTALANHLPRVENPPAVLHEAMRYAVLGGGKRLRPLLALMTCELFQENSASAIPAGCALEFAHTYSLIHDDLPAMDNDDLRRGRLTCHKAYDEPTAILAGDALLTLAFEVLAKHYPPEISAPAVKILASALGHHGMVAGQFTDIEGAKRRLAIDELELMYIQKTSALLMAAAQIGALIGGAHLEQQEKLADYGKEIGLLFQITDDLLDVTGTAEQLGKPVGQDAKANKSTFVAQRGISGAQTQAELYAKRARTAVTDFGANALRLRLLVEYLLKRQH